MTATIPSYGKAEWHTIIFGPYDVTDFPGGAYYWTFPILPTVRVGHTKLFPSRATLGPPDPDVDDTLSTLNYLELTGGQGVKVINPSTDLNRYWWGTADTSGTDGISNGPEVLRVRPSVYTGNCVPIGRIGDAMYALWGQGIHQWDPDDQTWSNSLATLPAPIVSDPVIFDDKAFFPLGSTGYSYIGESSSRTLGAIVNVTGAAAPTSNDPIPTSNPKVQVFGTHHQKLWAVTTSADGHQLASSVSGATATWFWPYDSSRPVFVKTTRGITPWAIWQWVRPDGQKAMWLVTNKGCLIYNDQDTTWEETTFWGIPPHPNAGRASIPWRPGEALWISSGGGDAYQVTVSNVSQPGQGPGGRDQGMPVERRGDIISFASDLANLYALIQGHVVPGGSDYLIEEGEGSDPMLLPATSSSACLVANTGVGWRPLWETTSPNGLCTRAVVSDALKDNSTNDYRLFWGVGEDCFHMPCRLSTYSARQGRERGIDRFQTESYLEFGEFNAGAISTPKLFSHAAIELRHASAIEYVQYEYQTNRDDDSTWHAHPFIADTPDERTVLPFGLSNDGLWSSGLSARWLKQRIRMIGGGGTTTPIIRSMSLAYLPLQQDAVHQTYILPLPVVTDERSGKTREQILERIGELLDANEREPQFWALQYGESTYRAVISGVSSNEIPAEDRVGAVNLTVIQIPTNDGVTLGGL